MATTTPAPSPSLGADCPNPTNPRCTITIPGGGATHGTPDATGAHDSDSGSATDDYANTCRPPRDPNIPLDVDCFGCRWSPDSVGGMLARGVVVMEDYDQQLRTPGTALYRVECYEVGHPFPITTRWTVTTNSPPNPGVPATQLAQELSVTIVTPLPVINTSPRTGTYVGLKTFLWLPADQWQPVFESKSDGVKTVTLTATPYQVKWHTGENVELCDGPGQPYDPNGDEEQETTCMHTYATTSAQQSGLAYKVSATIFFKLTWTCAGRCDLASGELLTDKQMWSSARLQVAERQSLVTDAGGGTDG